MTREITALVLVLRALIKTGPTIGRTIKDSFLASHPMTNAIWGTVTSIGKNAQPTISGARAFGGPVSAGKRYLVGERGPEIFQPSTSGQVIPNNNISAANRTINNHITIHAAPGMNERTLADLVIARLNRQQMALSGGVLYDQ